MAWGVHMHGWFVLNTSTYIVTWVKHVEWAVLLLYWWSHTRYDSAKTIFTIWTPGGQITAGYQQKKTDLLLSRSCKCMFRTNVRLKCPIAYTIRSHIAARILGSDIVRFGLKMNIICALIFEFTKSFYWFIAVDVIYGGTLIWVYSLTVSL